MTGVGRRFGSTHALRAVDLKFNQGDSVLVIGPNGSGKSTLLKLACGLLRPTSGTVKLWGEDPLQGRGRIGYLGHEPRLYPYLSLIENLTFFAGLYGLPATRALNLLAAVGLTEKKDKLAHAASRGELQRAAIARALLNEPDILLADEPFNALDEEAAALLPVLVKKPGRTLLVASHDFEKGRLLAEQTVRLESGRVLSPT